jgi:transcriptional regulator with XRE-family HTH domain
MSLTVENRECFKNNVKLIRTQLGLTQIQFVEYLSKKIGDGTIFTQSNISTFEKEGLIPTVSKLASFKSAFPDIFNNIEEIYTKKLTVQFTQTKETE